MAGSSPSTASASFSAAGNLRVYDRPEDAGNPAPRARAFAVIARQEQRLEALPVPEKCSNIKNPWRPGKLRRIAAFLAVFLVLCGCAGWFLAKSILFVEGGSRSAEVIVVLGGDAGDRTFKAMELFKSGAAPRILVSGEGDNSIIRDRLLMSGIPEEAIFVEPDSRNTKENAELSVRWMKDHKVKSAIMVTSWYHSRRALACFHHFAGDIEFSSFPTYHDVNMDRKPSKYEVVQVVREYAAMLTYMARYRIMPVCQLKEAKSLLTQ